MPPPMKCKRILSLIFFMGFVLHTNAQQPNDIAGFWMSSQKNVIVEIYRDSLDFKGRVVWFDDTDDTSNPMHLRMDMQNPDKNLRTQKIIGLVVLKGLTFNTRCKCWQNGQIYDTQSGKTWNASIELENENSAKVRGFWHFEIFGRSMYFRRVRSATDF